jgi:hypothetical protein
MRKKTQSLAQALKELTQRKDLKFLSLLTWKGVINERDYFVNIELGVLSVMSNGDDLKG